MTHVLFITGEYPPLPGGVGAYTRELGRALAEQGARISVATSTVAGQQQAADGIDVYPVVERWGWRGVRTLGALARDLGADWLHVQYQTAAFAMHPAINFAPGTWHPSTGSEHTPQVAWTYHDLLVPYLFPKAGARLRRWVTLRPARTANLVITTNEGDWRQVAGGKGQVAGSRWQVAGGKGQVAGGRGQQIENRVPSNKQYAVSNKQYAVSNKQYAKIPIGSNIEGRQLSAEERRARRATRGYDDDDFVLAYFGFLNRSKGGATLVRTLHALAHRQAAQLPNVRLLMIGERVGASDPTNHAYLREVEALADELGVAERIQWTGHQPEAAVAADLNASDALLLPYVDGASLRRGTLMAGLANGCAIVTTTPAAPLPELVHERDLLFVPPGDVRATVAAVLRLACEPALAQSLRERARARSELFTWQSIAAAHLALYEHNL